MWAVEAGLTCFANYEAVVGNCRFDWYGRLISTYTARSLLCGIERATSLEKDEAASSAPSFQPFNPPTLQHPRAPENWEFKRGPRVIFRVLCPLFKILPF